MKSKYGLLLGCLALVGCSQSESIYDDYDKESLFNRIESRYAADDAMSVREAAESFVTRFPFDENIDTVRLRLLSSYIQSKRYKIATAYADRLLNGVLLNESYYEDVEYYKILVTIAKSKHWMAELLKMENVYRNYAELDQVVDGINTFSAKYPHSQYAEDLAGYKVEIDQTLAEYELGVALHYAKKGNIKASKLRYDRYVEKYAHIDSPILDQLESYLDAE